MNLLWIAGVALNIVSMAVNWKILGRSTSKAWPVNAVCFVVNATCLCYLIKF